MIEPNLYHEFCQEVISKKKRAKTLQFGSFFILAETEGFEPSSLRGHHDFEQKAVSTAPPLSVPEMCNTSTHSARFCKTNDFLREICEIDARNE